MWNPFKKPPHTRGGYEEAEEKVRKAKKETQGLRQSYPYWRPNEYEITPAYKRLNKAETKREKLKTQGHQEALKLENKYQRLLEELEEACKAGEDVEEKEETIREFEEKKLGMKPRRPLRTQGPYR